jgi:hypothetical protein
MKPRNLVTLSLFIAAPFVIHAADISVGVNVGGARIYLQETPPAPRMERHERAPGPDFVWIQGHWNHHHGRWEWMRGHWDRRPGYMYIPGHWQQEGPGWVWIEDQWIVPSPPHGAAIQMATPATQPPSSVIVQQAPEPGYSPKGTTIIEQPVPELIIEDPGRSPGHDFFWVGGHWAWQGVWIWMSGEWRRHPHFHEGAQWMQGHWENRGRGHVWIEGYWK